MVGQLGAAHPSALAVARLHGVASQGIFLRKEKDRIANRLVKHADRYQPKRADIVLGHQVEVKRRRRPELWVAQFEVFVFDDLVGREVEKVGAHHRRRRRRANIGIGRKAIAHMQHRKELCVVALAAARRQRLGLVIPDKTRRFQARVFNAHTAEQHQLLVRV